MSTCDLHAPNSAGPSWHLAFCIPALCSPYGLSVLSFPSLQGLPWMELVGLHVMSPGNPWELTALHHEVPQQLCNDLALCQVKSLLLQAQK